MKTKRLTQQQVIQIKINFIKARVGCEKFTRIRQVRVTTKSSDYLGVNIWPYINLTYCQDYRFADYPA